MMCSIVRVLTHFVDKMGVISCSNVMKFLFKACFKALLGVNLTKKGLCPLGDVLKLKMIM